MANIFTQENFKKEVLEAEEVVLVDFYADWCGPCKMMSPIIDEIATEMEGKAKVGKINVDQAPEIAQQYSVMNIPTLLIIKDGEVKDKFVGVVAKDQLIEKLNSNK